MPKISIIIPCYNQGQYVDEAVDSVLNQTFQDFEIIIINDGSTDSFTNDKLYNYNKSKTTVIHTKNNGLAATRNLGVSKSTGGFIQFLDADDILLPTKFQKQINVFENFEDIDICYTNYRFYDIVKNEILPPHNMQFLGQDTISDFLFRWERGLSIPIHTALFKRDVCTKVPFNSELRAKEDWLFWCTLALNESNFHFLNEELAYYRFHSSNMCNNKSEMYYWLMISGLLIQDKLSYDLKNTFMRNTIEHLLNSIEKNVVMVNKSDVSKLNEKINLLNSEKSNILNSKEYKIGYCILKGYRKFKKFVNKIV